MLHSNKVFCVLLYYLWIIFVFYVFTLPLVFPARQLWYCSFTLLPDGNDAIVKPVNMLFAYNSYKKFTKGKVYSNEQSRDVPCASFAVQILSMNLVPSKVSFSFSIKYFSQLHFSIKYNWNCELNSTTCDITLLSEFQWNLSLLIVWFFVPTWVFSMSYTSERKGL